LVKIVTSPLAVRSIVENTDFSSATTETANNIFWELTNNTDRIGFCAECERIPRGRRNFIEAVKKVPMMRE
jgi:hypothetical protein